MSEPRYSTPAAFQRAVTDKLKIAAALRRRKFNELSREFLLQRFLARVFTSPDSMWVLKGGTGLLMRLPGSRHSQDLDLFHRTANLETAVEELHEIAALSGLDQYRFVLSEPVSMTGGVEGATIKVTVYLGVQEVGAFPIDLSTQLELVAGIDTLNVEPIIEIDDVAPLPPFRIYPLPDQIADKICAMYSTYGQQQGPSTRYRDLADLVTIITATTFDAAATRKALDAESRRRGIELPPTMQLPAPSWTTGYKTAVRQFAALPPALHDVDAALEFTAICLNPLLAGEIVSGSWSSRAATWLDATPTTP
jgi:predicted nucleotidyltransferase component of viral defense system